MHHSDLPHWAFEASRYLARSRSDHFKNQFLNSRLRYLHRHEAYEQDVESIAGYMGEIGAAILLGLRPADVLLEMIVATRGMTRRDHGDLHFRGSSIDVKIEDFGGSHSRVLRNNVQEGEPYGCRLVNLTQFEQNGAGIDRYLFGVFDPPLANLRRLHQASRISWLGFAEHHVVARARHGIITPAGRTLTSPAKFIPQDSLLPISALPRMPSGRRSRDLGSQLTAIEESRVERFTNGLSAIIGKENRRAAA